EEAVREEHTSGEGSANGDGQANNGHAAATNGKAAGILNGNGGAHAGVFRGLPASAGVATGPARVILHPGEGDRILPGEILVAPFTDPGWTPYFLNAAGIVMDV